MDNKQIAERLLALRKKMKENGTDYLLIPTSDYHNSEYIAEYFRVRKFFSGFTGSAGTLLVSAQAAGLWTDGRYFLQAEKQLEGTGIELFKMQNKGVPTISEYLKEHMKKGETLAFDGQVLNANAGITYEKDLEDREIAVKYEDDPAAGIWTDRPALPCSKAYMLPEDLTGMSFQEKAEKIREKMDEKGCTAHFISKLDDICWLTNLRGADVECNPVFLAHFLLTKESAVLFIQSAALSEEVKIYCRDNDITIKEYRDIIGFAKAYKPDGNLLLDRANVSYTLYSILKDRQKQADYKLVNAENPSTLMKACKNPVELKNLRETYLKDSAELTKFIYWVKQNVGKTRLTETDISDKLDAMRAALPGFIELSFDTICGYAANGAIVHYKAEKETAATVEAKGLLLVDSGGTYMGGTTDVTRTIVLGELTPEMKKHYTLVAVAMLRLANARFPQGVTGGNLDAICREPLWREGIDFNHGTGHGVGYILNVHEDPVRIMWKGGKNVNTVALAPGMTLSDEPGVYITGSHGVRIENILEVVKDGEIDGVQFLKFAMLTYAPLERAAMDTAFMTPGDIELYNNYQKDVYDKVSPHLTDGAVRAWLQEMTAPLSNG